MNFNDALAKALRYSTDTIHTLLTELQKPEYDHHRWGSDDIEPTQGLRGVLADAMDEQGRDTEANLLRTKGQHVLVDENSKVRPAKFNPQRVLDHTYEVADQLYNATGGEYNPIIQIRKSYEHGYPFVDMTSSEWEGGEGMHIADVPNELYHHFDNIRKGYNVRGDEDFNYLLRSLRNSPYEDVDTQHHTEQTQ
jgi:hypothetical protein